MLNYFNYFTEIEEHFQRRRGSLLLLSTLDWALIETWREAGIPLEAALRGIDDAFDKYEARRLRSTRRLRQINGLAWCAQAVMEAAERLAEAATGVAPASAAAEKSAQPGFETQRIVDHLESAAQALDAAGIREGSRHEDHSQSWGASLEALALSLRSIAAGLMSPTHGAEGKSPNLEELERHLATLEERLFATLTAHVPEETLLRFKTEAARDLAAYRSRMTAVQLRQIEQQFVHKRLLEHAQLPRLSLFYMRQA